MVTIDRAAFAANLSRLREAAGYTTYALARALGTGLTAARHWEEGIRLPSLDTLVALCAILDCCPDDLLAGAIQVERWATTGDEGGVA